MVEVELVTNSNEQEYKKFVDNCSCALAQHTLEWRDVIVGVGADVPIYLLARESGEVVGALPSFLYECEMGNIMVSIPQAGGYGGVVVEGDCPYKEEVYDALLSRLVLEARLHGCLLVTISTPPFFGELSLYRKYFQPDFERENFIQYLDLRDDFLARIGTKQRGNIRRNVGKAERYGLEVRVEDSDEHFDQWYEIHRQRMEEIGANPIPRALFEGARRSVLKKNGGGLFAYVSEGSSIIGGAFFLGLNQVIDYFMGCFGSKHAKTQPNSLLVNKMLTYAQQQGFRYWNWQSSNSRASSVYRFKAHWGSPECCHYYLTKVVGDISELRQTPLRLIKEKYLWHYVMPYETLGQGVGRSDATAVHSC